MRPPPFLFKSWDVIVSVDMSFVNPAFQRGASSTRYYVIASLPHGSGFGNPFPSRVTNSHPLLFLATFATMC
jgi:hypothetical protein